MEFLEYALHSCTYPEFPLELLCRLSWNLMMILLYDEGQPWISLINSGIAAIKDECVSKLTILKDLTNFTG